MNKLSKITFFFLLIFAVTTKAQWQPTGGPSGGHVNCLAVGENKIFAGTDFGVYVSDNNGNSWQNTSVVFSNKINTLLYFNKLIFAGTDSGVYVFSEKKKNGPLLLKMQNWCLVKLIILKMSQFLLIFLKILFQS